jgi:hypothetical protein
MTYSYVLQNQIGQVRLNIPDRVEADAFWSDEELQAFLDQEGTVRCATAAALEAMASDEAYVQKQVRLLDIQTNGPAVAAELRARAQQLRALDAETDEDEDAGFEVAELVYDDFSLRERLINQARRNG